MGKQKVYGHEGEASVWGNAWRVTKIFLVNRRVTATEIGHVYRQWYSRRGRHAGLDVAKGTNKMAYRPTQAVAPAKKCQLQPPPICHSNTIMGQWRTTVVAYAPFIFVSLSNRVSVVFCHQLPCAKRYFWLKIFILIIQIKFWQNIHFVSW